MVIGGILGLPSAARKFRDEVRPRFGLMRGREFVMNDMYTFDDSVEAAQHTYEAVCSAYHRIFTRLGVTFVKVAWKGRVQISVPA